jgi:dolichyl-phosphate-mannose--protein O-mannosyl transferase
MTFLSICFSVSMAASTGSLLSPVTGVLAKEFRVSITKAALPGGYPLLTSGIGAYSKTLSFDLKLRFFLVLTLY